MTPPNRQTVAGQVYLDLRHLAQATGRATDERLQLYALEGVLGTEPIRIIGYPITMILAEKIVTAMQRGTANTRWRDFVDICALLTTNRPDPDELRTSITRVAEHAPRPSARLQMSSTATRCSPSHGGAPDGATTTPADFADLLQPVITLHRRAPRLTSRFRGSLRNGRPWITVPKCYRVHRSCRSSTNPGRHSLSACVHQLGSVTRASKMLRSATPRRATGSGAL